MPNRTAFWCTCSHNPKPPWQEYNNPHPMNLPPHEPTCNDPFMPTNRNSPNCPTVTSTPAQLLSVQGALGWRWGSSGWDWACKVAVMEWKCKVLMHIFRTGRGLETSLAVSGNWTPLYNCNSAKGIDPKFKLIEKQKSQKHTFCNFGKIKCDQFTKEYHKLFVMTKPHKNWNDTAWYWFKLCTYFTFWSIFKYHPVSLETYLCKMHWPIKTPQDVPFNFHQT